MSKLNHERRKKVYVPWYDRNEPSLRRYQESTANFILARNPAEKPKKAPKKKWKQRTGAEWQALREATKRRIALQEDEAIRSGKYNFHGKRDEERSKPVVTESRSHAQIIDSDDVPWD